MVDPEAVGTSLTRRTTARVLTQQFHILGEYEAPTCDLDRGDHHPYGLLQENVMISTAQPAHEAKPNCQTGPSVPEWTTKGGVGSRAVVAALLFASPKRR